MSKLAAEWKRNTNKKRGTREEQDDEKKLERLKFN
jgi:hypothetical protein